MKSQTKHAIHCLLFAGWMSCFGYYGAVGSPLAQFMSFFGFGSLANSSLDADWTTLSLLQWCVGLFRIICSICLLPQFIFNIIGLVAYDAFKEEVRLKASPILAPFICFRVVTKGLFPKLVKDTLNKNLQSCLDAGMQNFSFEVVTDYPLDLEKQMRVREIVVPKSYSTKNGSLYKARALHYCLESKVNVLQENDWIVHLDEETMLTRESINGILNFCVDGKYDFGQGKIVYATEPIVSWICTFIDCIRVADDMGKIRGTFKTLHRPYLSWKGSFIVAKFASESQVGFDHGPEASVAEDCYFAMVSLRYNHSYDFIEGEMHERSPFCVKDLIMQRRRWIQGIWLTVNSKEIPLRHKWMLLLNHYSWVMLPLLIITVMSQTNPIENKLPIYKIYNALLPALAVYMYSFGAFVSFKHICRAQNRKLPLFILASILFIPINAMLEMSAIVLAFFAKNLDFYIINKSLSSANLCIYKK